MILMIVALAACERPNDNVALRDEAIATSHFYKTVVEDMNKRGNDIVTRGGKITNGGAMPGADKASSAVSMAGQQLGELRGLVIPGPDGKSQIEKEADALFKDGKTAELQKLIDESNEKLEVGTRVIAGELTLAEAWIDGVERHASTTNTVAGTPANDAAGSQPTSTTPPSPEPPGTPGGGADAPTPARAVVPPGGQTHP